MLNTICVMGRLTREPELRMTQSEVPVCSFTVAVDRDAKKGETDFIDCVAWRTTAEFVNRNFAKGQFIIVHGSLQSRKWVDRNDQSRISWSIQVTNVYFGGDKKAEKKQEEGGFKEMEDEGDGELPF